MADDFLGKKMEDYQRGMRTNAYRPKTTPTGCRPGYWSLKFPSITVFVTGGTSGQGRAIIKALCNAGCKVSFFDSDKRGGEHTAQESGAQFICSDTFTIGDAIHRVIENRGRIDVLINCSQQYSPEATHFYLNTPMGSGRIINRIINIVTPADQADGVTQNTVEEILTMVSGLNVTINSVRTSGPEEDVAATVVFLCSPAAGYLNRIEI